MITYYLGAGASANKIPVIKSFHKEIRSFVNTIKNEKSTLLDTLTHSFPSAPEQLIELEVHLMKIADELRDEKYSSIDALIKQEEGGELYNFYKTILEMLLYYWDTRSWRETRYQTLWAKYISKKNGFHLRKPIQIISWNYDRQVELSLADYLKISLKEVETHLNRDPLIIRNDLINLFKLNGSYVGHCTIRDFYNLNVTYNETMKGPTVNTEITKAFFHSIIKYLSDTNSPVFVPNIRFSWDEDELSERIKNIGNRVTETEILAIIGYSFHGFNEDIDKFLLRSMDPLKIVYQRSIDDKSGALNNLKALLKGESLNIEDEFNLDNFITPPSLR